VVVGKALETGERVEDGEEELEGCGR